MKKCVRCFGLLLLTLVTGSVAEAGEYVINSQATTVTFKVRQFGMAEQTGEFAGATGRVVLDRGDGEAALEIVLDSRLVRADNNTAQSILRGRSMLDVEQYPAIEYSASHITFVEGKPDRIDGSLTLRGATRPVSLIVDSYSCVATEAGEQCRFEATAAFKRSEFGMRGFMGFVSDEVKLAILGVADSTIQ
ncbi:MAG: YceI family protein [Povalibacter sp.]